GLRVAGRGGTRARPCRGGRSEAAQGDRSGRPRARVDVARLKAVWFDAGETLVDETGIWERAADAAGVPRFTLMATLGGLITRGDHHSRVWEVLGAKRGPSMFQPDELYPDALGCLTELRARGVLVGVVGNTPREFEDDMRKHADFVGSSASWGVEKPAPAFFERIVAETGVDPGEIAYVGDRVDNDVVPALAA